MNAVRSGVDARDGCVATHGWLRTSDTPAVAFCATLRDAGVRTVIYTDISRDGRLAGANLEVYQALCTLEGLDIVASGGVSTLEDIGRICKLTDALDNIDWLCAPVSAMDLAVDETKCRPLREWKEIFTNLTKPLMADPDPRYIEDYFEMEVAMYDGDRERALKEPVSIMGCCPSSPLQLDESFGIFALTAPKYGFPMMVLSMAMGAASAPINIAGTLVVHNAEVLAGITLIQSAFPGAPCFYGSSTTVFDFYSNSSPVGSPELALISAGVAQLGNHYRIPTVVAGT